MTNNILVMKPILDSPENGIVKGYQLYEVPLDVLNETAFTANAENEKAAICAFQGYSRAKVTGS